MNLKQQIADIIFPNINQTIADLEKKYRTREIKQVIKLDRTKFYQEQALGLKNHLETLARKFKGRYTGFIRFSYVFATNIFTKLIYTEEEEVLAEAKEAVTPAESEPQLEEPITEKDLNEAVEEFEEALSFARLLVSEIKLYNEDSVEEGRKNGDLYSRLKEQIDLSREVYEARIADEVRTEKDYFGEELVRILANGNTKLLDT